MRKKWHTSRRNVMVGDVDIHDNDTVRGEWKMDVVSKAQPSADDGAARNCTVKYKHKLPVLDMKERFTMIKRPVKKLVILVAADENLDDETS